MGNPYANFWGPPLLSLLLARLSSTISSHFNQLELCYLLLQVSEMVVTISKAPLCARVWEVAPGRKLG